MKKNLYKIIIFASLMGLIISSYLTYNYYADKSVVCVSDEHEKICDNVLKGPYTVLLFNIPNSVIGISGFFILFVLGYLGLKGKRIKNLMLILSSAALVFVLYLAYLVLFVIKSFCICCFTAWILIIIIFVCSILLKEII